MRNLWHTDHPLTAINPNLHAALSAAWKGAWPEPSPNGATAAFGLEQRLGIRLPQDFRDYLCHAAPADHWDNPSQVLVWPPDVVMSLWDFLEVTDERPPYLAIADYLGWCGYGYALCCADGPDYGKVALIETDTVPERFIAASFTDFVRLVAENSDLLHPS